MNEVTTVHLGREVFTMSVEAHRELQHYLRDIAKQVGDDKEVLEEIEARMAELLRARHISDDKVVLPKDVAYLKEQLGDPSEFGDDASEASAGGSDQPRRRFFRDPENAMVAGVAAGLAAFTGIPVIAIRIVFVLLTFSGGTGLLLYILLWLLAPEAKTPTERLQMQGKPVTVDTLKDMVDRADVRNAAARVGSTVGPTVTRAVRIVVFVVLGIIGVALMIAGIAIAAAMATAVAYALVHGVFVGGTLILPVGAKEVWAVACVGAVGLLFALALATTGYSVVKHKWALPGWLTAALITLVVLSGSLGTALSLDVRADVASRIQANQHSTFISEPTFSQLYLKNMDDVSYDFSPDGRSGVEIQTLGNAPSSDISVSHKGQALYIDASNVSHSGMRCGLICPYGRHNIQIVIHTPTDFDGVVDDADGKMDTRHFTVTPSVPVPPKPLPRQPADPKTTDNL